ncbi:MAG: 3'-5' exonuclease [Flavobacteriaceae bacterium]|nr:3'-5' exonuclease [Flavobacteriaceae bacterium]
MFSIFQKKKDYPNYWQEYIASFNSPYKEVPTTRFVIFDTETTGLNMRTDRILSIGCVGVYDYTIKIADQLESYLLQEKYTYNTVEIHGILKAGRLDKVKEEEAIIQFLDYIKNAVLVAHHADFDVGMINLALKRMGLPKLKNKAIDTAFMYKESSFCKNQYSPINLDVLSKKFHIPKHDRHTASGDAYITAQLFLKLLKNLERKPQFRLNDYFGGPPSLANF